MSGGKRSQSEIFRELNNRLRAKRTKKGGKGKEQAPKRRNELIVQRLSSEVSGKAQKYSRIGPREFVSLSEGDEVELTMDLVKRACEKHFGPQLGANLICDVLAGEQGPSCSTIKQIPDLRVIHVRFVARIAPQEGCVEQTRSRQSTESQRRYHFDSVRFGSSPLREIAKSDGPQRAAALEKHTAPSTSEFVAMSLSVADMIKLGQLGAPSRTTIVKLYSFDLESQTWAQVPITVEFLEEEQPIGKGGFRTAYKAKTRHPQFRATNWVIKRYLPSAVEGIHSLGQTTEQHTRKVVQMHLLARNFASQLEQKIAQQDMSELFGKCLAFKKIYYGEISVGEGETRYVTVEEFIDGRFRKYTNNNGAKCFDDTDAIGQKAECLAHFSYEKSERKLLLVDIQGCGYQLFDPEIASADLYSADGDGREILYCAGNLSTRAIDRFVSTHKCNAFCGILGLETLKSQA